MITFSSYGEMQDRWHNLWCMSVCVCACVRVRACMCVCLCVFVHVCVICRFLLLDGSFCWSHWWWQEWISHNRMGRSSVWIMCFFLSSNQYCYRSQSESFTLGSLCVCVCVCLSWRKLFSLTWTPAQHLTANRWTAQPQLPPSHPASLPSWALTQPMIKPANPIQPQPWTSPWQPLCPLPQQQHHPTCPAVALSSHHPTCPAVALSSHHPTCLAVTLSSHTAQRSGHRTRAQQETGTLKHRSVPEAQVWGL